MSKYGSLLLALALLAGCGADGETSDSASSAATVQNERGPEALGEAYAAARAVEDGPVVRGAVATKSVVTGSAETGAWGAVVDWPVIPIHASLLPDGRVMTFGTDQSGKQGATLDYNIWDPTEGTGPNAHLTLPNGTNTNIFCASQISLSNGALQIFGGDVDNEAGNSTNRPNPFVTEFGPGSETLSKVGQMNRSRWYSSAVMMPDGSVVIQGGSGGRDYPEVRETNGQFRLLTGASTQGLAAGFPRNFVAPDGSIFGIAGNRMYRLDPTDQGSIDMLPRRQGTSYGGSSATALFAPGKVLQVGGGNGSDGSRQAWVIDFTGTTPVQTRLPDLTTGRHWANTTVLADGTVAISGGSQVNNKMSGEIGYAIELFNPANGSITVGPLAQQARLYHSTAILLPDGSLLTGGGGAPGPQRNLNAEIYYPPYLFNDDGTRALRPVIAQAPAIVAPGSQFQLGLDTPAPIARVTMVRSSSVTHSANFDQRFLELPFSQNGSGLTVEAPQSGIEAPPGTYMVFVIDQHGVPSVAALVAVPVAGNQTSANLLVNGSFETNLLADGQVQLADSISGWGSAGNAIELWRNTTGVIAANGHTLVQLDATASLSDTLDQTVTTEPGRLYRLSFAYAAPPGQSAATSRFEVLLNGQVIDSITPDNPGQTGVQWQQWAYSIRGTGRDTISFREAGANDGVGALLDNIQLSPRGGNSDQIGPVDELPPQITGFEHGSNQAPIRQTGQTSQFTAQLSEAVAGDTYTWSFGDGTVVTTRLPSVQHTYEQPGLYTVQLTVVGQFGSDSRSFRQLVHAPILEQQASSSTTIALAPAQAGSNQLWVVNPDQDSVSVIDTGSNQRIAVLPVGQDPRSIAVRGGFAYVLNRGSDSISIFRTVDRTSAGTISLPNASNASAIVVDASAQTAYVSLTGHERILKLRLADRQIDGSIQIGPQVRHLGLSNDGLTLLATRFITPPVPGEHGVNLSLANGGGEVLVIDTPAMTLRATTMLLPDQGPDAEDGARGLPNYLMAPVFSPDGQTAAIPFKADNIYRGLRRDGQPREFDRLVRSKLALIDLASLSELRARRVDFDNNSPATAAAFGPWGNHLFVVHEGSRQLQVLDAYRGGALASITLGHAPQGVTVAPDGSRVYVHNWLDRTVSVIDSAGLLAGSSNVLEPVATIQLTDAEKLAAAVLRGKRLFHDAHDPRLTRENYQSCASCHHDGGEDGRVWDFSDAGEGLRNTIDLRGRRGTGHGKLHWSANFDEIHDFEGDIRHVFGGTGLMSDEDFAQSEQPLGPPKGGQSASLDDLVAYVSSLATVGTSPHRASDGSLTVAATEGRVLFAQLGCIDCHGGSDFTDSATGQLHDIGTLTVNSGARLGDYLAGIDTPTLRGSWANPPYLHDGSAPDLETAILAHNLQSPGFNIATLPAVDLARLAAYVRQIDDRESAAPLPDNDGDGLDDIRDPDDDNDGVPDAQDAFPFDPDESVDTDGDGIGNNSDDDDDGDGVPDVSDSHPLDPDMGRLRCNLIDNGDFEAGVDGWLSSGVVTASNAALSGSLSLRFSGGWVSQAFTVGQAAQMTLSGQYRAEGGTGWLGLGLDYLDGNFAEIGETVRSLEQGNAIGSFSIQGQPPLGTRYIRVWFYAGGDRSLTVDELDLRKTGCEELAGEGNQPPVISNPGAQQAEVGESISLTLDAADPEGDPIRFSATGLPDGLSIDQGSGEISGYPSMAGQYSVTITASDLNLSNTTVFDWRITAPGDAAACNLLPNPSFESDLNGWQHNDSANTTSQAAAGNLAMQLQNGWISTSIAATPGQQFTLSARYRSAGEAQWMGVGVDFLDAGHAEIGESVMTLSPTAQFDSFQMNVDVPPRTEHLRVWFYAESGRLLIVDDISLIEQACPA